MEDETSVAPGDHQAPKAERAAISWRSLAMFEEGRPCVDLAQQLHAVESAVSNAKRELIHDHIEHCLDGPDADTKTAVRELKQLAKYL